MCTKLADLTKMWSRTKNYCQVFVFEKKSIAMAFEFFTVCTKLAEMAILYSKDLTTAKKKLPPVGLDLMLQIITGLGVQCLTR